MRNALFPVMLQTFFGCCFGVTECATAHHFLSRDPEREPPLTENAGCGERDVTRNLQAEKMRRGEATARLPDLLHQQIVSADGGQRLA